MTTQPSGMVRRLQCPKGHTVLQSQHFCSDCGTKLVMVEVPGCSDCNYAWVGNDKFCPHCGGRR